LRAKVSGVRRKWVEGEGKGQRRTEPAYDNWHGGVTAHGYEEQSCVLQRTVIVYRDQDGEADDCDADGKDSITESMACFVGEIGEDHCKGEGGGPGGYTVELCLDFTVAVAIDDWRWEVCVARRELISKEISEFNDSLRDLRVSRNNQTEVHETAEEDFVVFEYVAYVFGSHLAFDGWSTLFAAEAVDDICSLFVREPFAVFREIWKDEEEGGADNASKNAFEDENLWNPVSRDLRYVRGSWYSPISNLDSLRYHPSFQ
jgi:hypothetical protein